MAKIIKLTEVQLNKIVKKVIVAQEKENILKEQTYDNNGGGDDGMGGRIAGGTSTASSGSYVTPGGINFKTNTPGGANDRTYTEQPSLRYGGYDDDNPDPYDRDNPKPKKSGSYETLLKRSPMCCKKCKNGKFKHQCDDTQKGGKLRYDSTNCVYATISDCQLNKRSKPGNISGKKKKSKK